MQRDAVGIDSAVDRGGFTDVAKIQLGSEGMTAFKPTKIGQDRPKV